MNRMPPGARLGGRGRSRSCFRSGCRRRCRCGSRCYLRGRSGCRCGLGAGNCTLVLRAGAGNRLGASTRGGFRTATRSRLGTATGSGLGTATGRRLGIAAGGGGGVVRVLGLDDLADHLHDLLSLLGVAVALLQLDGDLLHVLRRRALFGPGASAVADHDASSLDDDGCRRGRGCCGGVLSHGERRQGCQHGDECLLHNRV